MKTLIKLLIVAAVMHACWKSGAAYWRYYMLQDGAQAAALFSGTQSPAEIHNRVIKIARDLDVPISPDNLEVRREPNHIYINTTYTEKIELLPRYFYPWEFTLKLNVLTLSP